MKTQLHFGGIPTGPQVKMIEKAIPDPLALRGEIVTHETLEAATGERRDTHRYRTVVGAWRRKVFREHALVISGRGTDGQGLLVLDNDDQVGWSVAERNGAMRKVRRGFIAVTNVEVDRLSDDNRRLREHELLSFGRIQAALIKLSIKALPAGEAQ